MTRFYDIIIMDLYNQCVLEFETNRNLVADEMQQKLDFLMMALQNDEAEVDLSLYPALPIDEIRVLFQLPRQAQQSIFCSTVKSLDLKSQQIIQGDLSFKGDVMWKTKAVKLDIKNGVLELPTRDGNAQLPLSQYTLTWVGEVKGIKKYHAFKFEAVSNKYTHYKTLTLGSDDLKYAKQWYKYAQMAYDFVSKKENQDQIKTRRASMHMSGSIKLGQEDKPMSTPPQHHNIRLSDNLKDSQILELNQENEIPQQQVEVLRRSDMIKSQNIEEEIKFEKQVVEEEERELVFPNDYDLWFSEDDLLNVTETDGYQYQKSLQQLQIFKLGIKWKVQLKFPPIEPKLIQKQVFENECQWNIDYRMPLGSEVEVDEADYHQVRDQYEVESLERSRFKYRGDHYVTEQCQSYQLILRIHKNQNQNSTYITGQLNSRTLTIKVECLQNLESLMDFYQRISDIMK